MIVNPAKVIAQILIADGVASAAGAVWPVTTSKMPEDTIDNRLAVYNTGGVPDGVLHSEKLPVYHPSILIRIRSKTEAAGVAKGKEIFNALRDVSWRSMTVDGVDVIVQAVTQTIPFLQLGQEEKINRQIFTMDYKLTISEA